MLHHAGVKAFHTPVDGGALGRQPAVMDTPVTRDESPHPRDTEAAFPRLLHLIVQRLDDGVYEDGAWNGGSVGVACAPLHSEHDHAARLADLRGGQTYSAPSRHRVPQVFDERRDARAAELDFRHRLRHPAQYGMSHSQDGSFHILIRSATD